jgi:hypothetical protein
MPLEVETAPPVGSAGFRRNRQDGRNIVKRLIHPLLLTALLVAAFLPAAAAADGGVLLSGYAPPGAGEEAILGAAPSGGSGGHGSSRAVARPQSALPLAQPEASTTASRPAAAPAAAPRRAHTARRTAAATHRASHRAPHTRTVAVTRTASPAIIAAATRDAPGGGFGLWPGVLAAALAIMTFTLGRLWLKRDE